MIVEKFQPIKFQNTELKIQDLNNITGVEWNYAVSGKAALYHCLRSLNVRGKILIPVYICSSILESISKLKINYSCYDINLNDLNPNLIDVENKIISEKVSCIIVASMYGNPANLSEIERLCKKYNVLMVDDAAQSFGSKYNNKFVGTFGDAGFFSFSPGKPTSGHLGAFFWTKNSEYKIKRTNHYILHKLAYWDFYFNRYHIYEYKKYLIFKMLSYLKHLLFNVYDLYNDKINNFEKAILGGVLRSNNNQTFRSKMLNHLNKEISKYSSINLITSGESNSNNHKIVFICVTKNLANYLFNKLNNYGIYTAYGYNLIKNYTNCPNAQSLQSRILELPLEDDNQKNIYLKNQLIKLLEKYEDSGNHNYI